MFLFKRDAERGFTTEVYKEEIKDLIEKSTNEGFIKQWNAGVSEKSYRLAKEHLDERLISDSLGVAGEKCDTAKFNKVIKDDIRSAIESLGHDWDVLCHFLIRGLTSYINNFLLGFE